MQNTSKENFLLTVNHRKPEKLVVDFESTTVTGIHAMVVEKLRDYHGLGKIPVKIIEPYQMLGEIDKDLVGAMKVDVIDLGGEKNMFGIPNRGWKTFKN